MNQDRHFVAELEELKRRLLTMGGLAEERLRAAVRALVDRNHDTLAKRYLLHPPVKPLIDLPRMGELALKMLRESLDAFVSRDVSLAQAVLRPKPC